MAEAVEWALQPGSIAAEVQAQLAEHLPGPAGASVREMVWDVTKVSLSCAAQDSALLFGAQVQGFDQLPSHLGTHPALCPPCMLPLRASLHCIQPCHVHVTVRRHPPAACRAPWSMPCTAQRRPAGETLQVGWQ